MLRNPFYTLCKGLQDKYQNIFFRAGILWACVTIARARFPSAAVDLLARIVLIVIIGTNLYDVYVYVWIDRRRCRALPALALARIKTE